MINDQFAKNIIFVGGIHGVGKTTLCKEISQNLLVKHYSASQLISDLDSEGKRVNDIHKNQNNLLEAINRYLSNKEYYLLDGHFCLLSKDGIITRIPIDTFKSLRLKALIVLVDEENEIIKRLNYRDTIHYLEKFIKEFQEEEINYAQEVAREIGITIKVINVTAGSNEMIKFINSTLCI